VNRVQFSLLDTQEKIDMVKSCIVGGINQVNIKHIKAINENLDNFDSNKDICYLTYLGIFSLYGSVMAKEISSNRRI
jgi:hypothetical protein